MLQTAYFSAGIHERRHFIKSDWAFLVSFFPFRFLPISGKDPIVYEITGDPTMAVSELFSALGGIGNLIGNDLSKASVLVKPNLCLPHKDSNGTITSITTLKALCEYLINEGVGRIIIADHTLQTADKFETNDIVAYARGNPKISLMLADDQRYYAPRQVEGKVLKTAETMKILDKVNYFINLATAKHHSATHVSLCIKISGDIWDRRFTPISISTRPSPTLPLQSVPT
jgi:uncharacterized protein (DUF362 family)